MAEKITVSLIKADVGSIAGHSRPHPRMMEVASESLGRAVRDGLLADYYVTRCGDDMQLLMTHRKGENNREVHELAWTPRDRTCSPMRSQGT
jgi:fructose 1,6-bisphosphate aldolase/phosphatase